MPAYEVATIKPAGPTRPRNRGKCWSSITSSGPLRT